MTPSRDAEFLNRVANHPAVLPEIGMGLESIDLTPLVEDPRNYFLANEYGGFLLVNQGDGIYEVHTQFLPEGRGEMAIKEAMDGMRYMFTKTDCKGVMTYCPPSNRPAIALSIRAGMRHLFDCERLGRAMRVYGITREEWQCLQQSP